LKSKSFKLILVLLLGYIIASYSFWWYSLEKQSNIIYRAEITALNTQINKEHAPAKYAQLEKSITNRKTNRSHQYLGEGITFFLIIMVGTSIVFTTYRMSQKLSQQQNNFMLSVTHELKSPIASIKLILQTLEKHQLDEEKRNQLLKKCLSEADRLNDLSHNILIASQVEGGQYKINTEYFSISELLSNSVDHFNSRFNDRIALEVNNEIQIHSDQLLLQLVLHNLLSNALKYVPKEEDINVTASISDHNRIIIQVKDTGKGIPDTEKKKVFEKFYRIGNEDTRKTKGTGLGLYLSKKIVTHLNGTLSLRDNSPKGALFEISLPLDD
jgi:signal transduction histidine kinase